MKKMKLNFFLLLICGFLAFSCDKDNSFERPVFTLEKGDYISEVEYEIYSFVINEQNYSNSKIVIEQETSKAKFATLDELLEIFAKYRYYPHNNMPDNNMINSFYSLNDTNYNLEEKFNIVDKQAILISSAEVQYMFSGSDYKSNWQKFFNTYQNSFGLIKFSRIVFNDNFTEAILEFDETGYYGGTLHLIYLNKENNSWIIKWEELIIGDVFPDGFD